MEPEKLYEWLDAVEVLMTSDENWYIENDFGDYVLVGDMTEGGRYEKMDRSYNFCGATNSAAEAVLWLYENNKSDEEF